MSEKKAERVGVVQPEEEKALGRLFSSLSALKVGQKKKMGTDILPGPVLTCQWVTF